jgi:hypothetical protein
MSNALLISFVAGGVVALIVARLLRPRKLKPGELTLPDKPRRWWWFWRRP